MDLVQWPCFIYLKLIFTHILSFWLNRNLYVRQMRYPQSWFSSDDLVTTTYFDLITTQKQKQSSYVFFLKKNQQEFRRSCVNIEGWEQNKRPKPKKEKQDSE